MKAFKGHLCGINFYADDSVWIWNQNVNLKNQNFEEEKDKVDQLAETDDAGSQNETQPTSNFSWKYKKV
jgi:hypothetical protein